MRDPVFERYAIFASPRPDTELAAFARGWFGYDAETGTPVQPVVPAGLSPQDHLALVATPARYGFHGTLKAPFRLAGGVEEPVLLAAVQTLAAGLSPVTVPALSLATLGGFIALVPSQASETVSLLAESCVTELDACRAPLLQAEIERRRPARLTDAQARLLADWGYPYVLEEFRFHLTLTGPLAGTDLDRAHPILERATAPVRADPFRIEDLCVFGDPGGGAPFRLVRRFALGCKR